MKVAVLGAGVMGVTTAHALWRLGHEVVVLERGPGPALETSLGNAGGLCPGFAGPWAAPGMPWKVLKMSLQADAAVRFRPRLDPAQWAWLISFLRNCSPQRFARNKAAMQRIAHFSLACLQELRAEIPLDYDGAQKGVLQLLQTDAEMETGSRAARVLASLGIPHTMLDRAGVLAQEPALARANIPIAGGLHLPNDETGDCHKFTTGLADYLARQGVEFRYGTEVTGIAAEGPFPPDTAFLPATRAQTGGYICMYHDQGHIPFKMLAFECGVNVTLGLPIVRTSVDHGTAFDIAWQGIADPSSLFHAIRMAVLLCPGQ